MDRNLVILAAGVSSRMRQPSADPQADRELMEQADRLPKAMLPVGKGGRPFLDYLARNARDAGYTDAVLVVNEHDESIRPHYADGADPWREGLRISFAVQGVPSGRSKPLGTADALLAALRARPDWNARRFTVCNSDNLYSVRALRMLLESPHANVLLDYDRDSLGVHAARIERFAVIRKDADGFLQEIIEKPTPEQIRQVRDGQGRVGVSMNIFRLGYDDIRPQLETVAPHPVRREKELPTAVAQLARACPRLVMTLPIAEQVPDLTAKEDIAPVRRFLRLRDESRS